VIVGNLLSSISAWDASAFSPIGEPLYRIVSCGSRMITNIAFGVDNPSRLFIVDSLGGAILCADLPIRGRPPFSHGET
jgi:gluconolactonase